MLNICLAQYSISRSFKRPWSGIIDLHILVNAFRCWCSLVEKLQTCMKNVLKDEHMTMRGTSMNFTLMCRQVRFYLIQQYSGILQEIWKVAPVNVCSQAHSRSWQDQRPHKWSLGFGITAGSGLHGLSHSLPLCEDGLAGSSPFSWPFETILVRSTGTEQNSQSQPGISQQQLQEVGANSHQLCYLIHVSDIVNLDGVSLTGDIPETRPELNMLCITRFDAFQILNM